MPDCVLYCAKKDDTGVVAPREKIRHGYGC